ncbi:MAG: serine protease [Anaerolineae bacterium]|jgi:hypothetical protein|nr:serine protease [Anaerolineae bacterium]
MAGIYTIQQGILTIQEGNLDEGARLIRIGLRDPRVSGTDRAIALVWLAETFADNERKIRTYNEALQADANNAPAKERLNALMTAGLPAMNPRSTGEITLPNPPPAAKPILPNLPTPTPIPPPMATPVNLPPQPTFNAGGVGAVSPNFPNVSPSQNMVFFRTVGILDGPHGVATGFFVTPNGIIATTRYAVSGMENVVIALDSTRQLMGRVIRSFPDLDLALIYLDVTLSQLLPFSTQTALPENLDISAFAHSGQIARGRHRSTKRDLKSHWFATTIRQLPDAGGNPVFDDRNYLIGMLTRNTSRSSPDVFALRLNVILQQVELYKQDLQLNANRSYCPSCGSLSQAALYGAFYCEFCGSVLPNARSHQRYPVPQASALYNELSQRPCRNKSCGVRIGYYNGKCLRCGHAF